MEFLGFEDENEQDQDEESEGRPVENDLSEPPIDNAEENKNHQVDAEADGERRSNWSKVWEHFKLIVYDSGQKFGKCNYCSR